MQELTKRGYAAVRATKDGAHRVRPPRDRREEILQQRKKGKFLAVEPRLLLDQKTVERATTEHWLKRRGWTRGYLQDSPGAGCRKMTGVLLETSEKSTSTRSATGTRLT